MPGIRIAEKLRKQKGLFEPFCSKSLRPMTKPANAKIYVNDEKGGEIFAFIVNLTCKYQSLTAE